MMASPTIHEGLVLTVIDLYLYVCKEQWRQVVLSIARALAMMKSTHSRRMSKQRFDNRSEFPTMCRCPNDPRIVTFQEEALLLSCLCRIVLELSAHTRWRAEEKKQLTLLRATLTLMPSHRQPTSTLIH